MKEIDYRTSGICARSIHIVLDDDNKIADIDFFGGCDGNHKGLISLCKGQKAEDVIPKLRGITCGFKSSSCPDQLAKALEEAI